MFKVLIADDEYYVMSLIMEIVDWARFDMEVVGTADNGFTAMEMIRKREPDIMIVDVQMPGCDGITLMQKARELGSSIKFIVISGHRRFDYAKSAIKYNVEDYLLKPISKGELETILLRLKNQLEEEQAKRREIDQLDNQLGLSKSRMHALLMKELLSGEGAWAEMDVRRINENYLTRFGGGIYRCVIVKLDSGGQDMNPDFLNDRIQSLETIYKEHLAQICAECIGCQEQMRLYLLLDYHPEDECRFRPLLEQAAAQSAAQLDKFENLCQTVAVGDAVNGLGAAYGSLQSARLAIDSRFELGCGGILSAGQVRNDPGILRVILSDQRFERLTRAMKSLEPGNVQIVIEELYGLTGQYAGITTLTFHLCLEIHKAFYEYIRHIDVFRGSYEDLYQELWPELENCRSKDDVKNALIRHIAGFIDQHINNKHDSGNPSVRIAIRYIQENYHTNLTLAGVSAVVNLTPVYFSIVFKRDTGMTFIDYLNKFRVQSAKKMLKDSRYNINEIADKCGYQDARYFSKIFKKNVGITPSEYRSRQTR